jgi:serine/threonine protein kinase
VVQTGESDPEPELGQYMFRETIGEGSFATVRLCEHQMTKEVFVCKIVAKCRLTSNVLRLRFEAEIRTHQQVCHAGVIGFYDVLQDSEFYYMILEFCPKGDLFRCILNNGGFTEDSARPHVALLLSALEHLHFLGISHRDLKPENILLDHAGAFKISDFGLAKFIPDSGLLRTPCGSPCYASPECISGRAYDGRATDVWSLGVIVFVMLTGALPWTERNQPKLFRQVSKGRYKIPPSLSPTCRSFIKGLMTVNPADRMTVAQAMSHPWMENTPIYRGHSMDFTNQMTLKWIDRFFERDVPDLGMPSGYLVRAPSLPSMPLMTVRKWVGLREVETEVIRPVLRPAPSILVSEGRVSRAKKKENMAVSIRVPPSRLLPDRRFMVVKPVLRKAIPVK